MYDLKNTRLSIKLMYGFQRCIFNIVKCLNNIKISQVFGILRVTDICVELVTINVNENIKVNYFNIINNMLEYILLLYRFSSEQRIFIYNPRS